MSDSLPLSLLNDYLYCPRRAALKAIEGWWGENEHTVLGSLAHDFNPALPVSPAGVAPVRLPSATRRIVLRRIRQTTPFKDDFVSSNDFLKIELTGLFARSATHSVQCVRTSQ
jgi:hypothetical protein